MNIRANQQLYNQYTYQVKVLLSYMRACSPQLFSRLNENMISRL